MTATDTPRTDAEKLAPLPYALAGFLVTPLLVGMLIAGACLITAAWPLLPVLLYFQRKEKLNLQSVSK